jgi:osmotically-inducible protein OsmY
MYKLTFTTVALVAAVLVAFASTAAAREGKGGNRIVKAGTCSASSHSKIKAKTDDGRIETEFEVDQNRIGKRWRVTLSLNGSNVFRGIKRTTAPSGSFEVRRLLAGATGSRIVATARSLSGGETCRASISL